MKSNKTIKELYHVNLYVCDSVKKAKKVHSQFCEDELEIPEVEFGGLTHYEDSIGLIIVVFDKNFIEMDIYEKLKVISHETYHVLRNILDFIGEYGEAEEMNAYLTGYINKYIIKELKILN